MTERPVPCVVFDLGGVLLRPEGPAAHLAQVLGVTVEQLLVPYWRHRDDYDRGGAADAFWDAVRRDLTAGGCTVRSVTNDELDRIDAERWAQLSDGAAALLEQLGRCGTATAVLSNAPASLAATVRAAAWSRGFGQLVFSCDLGLMKPEPEIYRAVEQRTGRPAGELLFFDDRPVNVGGAAALGWQAHLWQGVPEARQVLAAAGALAP